MQGNAGIWIDHKEAFIVFAGATEADAKDAGVDKHVKFSGHGSGHEGSNEDKREGLGQAHRRCRNGRQDD